MKPNIPPVLIIFGLVCFALVQNTQAVSPPPDGGYPGFNTAEGQNALLSLTSGIYNTAVGFSSLKSNTTGNLNTAIGINALSLNTTGFNNTADGGNALYSNTGGSWNTATGWGALFSNTTGEQNTVNGAYALVFNNGSNNTAVGFQALLGNTTGNNNTATGDGALSDRNTGDGNTATGAGALFLNQTGSNNTAVGFGALVDNTTGSSNIAIGNDAGSNLTTGDLNIDIGALGIAGESATIRIGGNADQTRTFIAGITGVAVTGAPVVIDANGQLGVAASSARFKDEIKPMNEASEAILALKPVTFRYKPEIDAKRAPQFGLVAEDVAKVNPDLVARDREGKPFTVRYEAVNAMLLNEFLKEHKKTEKLEATVASLTATVKEQAAQIQKVSAQLEASRSAPQVADSDY
jgi:hypothetical protein